MTDPDASAAPSTGRPSGPSKPRPKRKRRRGRGKGPRPGPAPKEVLTAPRLTDAGPDVPLSPHEAAVMKGHLRLLQRYKKVLGLSLNAKEDLLINGTVEPAHRGVCLHLLGKVERANVERALERLPDPAERTRLLGGVVRFSDDQGVLLMWLESLTDSASRAAAAGALPLALDRLDWEAMSAARLERLLDVLASVFSEPHERADVVFGLLHSPSFRATFEEAQGRLPKPLAGVFAPLRAAFDAVVLGDGSAHSPGLVRKGVGMLLSAPEAALAARPQPVRERLLRAALAAPAKDADADRAAGALLESLTGDPETYRTLALERIGELLSRHADPRAEWHLKRLRAAQPDCVEAKELTLALHAPRVGRIVLGTPQDWRPKPKGQRAEPPPRKGLQPAFWLDRQRSVWARVGGDAKRVAAEAARHDQLLMEGLAPLLAAGGGKRPWLAFARVGRPLEDLIGHASSTRRALLVAASGLRILGSVARAGLQLPDARPRRFLLVGGDSPRLLLHDLSGAFEPEEPRSEPPPGQAAGLARDILKGVDLPPGVRRVLSRRKGGARSLLAEIEAAL